MMVVRDNILVDLDHTLSNAFWRDGMMPPVATWDEYHAANKDDKPIFDMVNLIGNLRTAYKIIGITARPEKWRTQTMEWCMRNRVLLDELLMRPEAEFRPANEIKVELARKFCGHHDVKDCVAFILDDRDDVCAAFAEIGVTALRVTARRD
jgi:hypothetical protein